MAAVIFLLAGMVTARVSDPAHRQRRLPPLGRDALDGLLYVVRNPTLRALAVVISLYNFVVGVGVVVIPVLVEQKLHDSPAVVGLLFAFLGAGGVLSAVIFGRLGSEGRERGMLAGAAVAVAAATLLLASASVLWVTVVAMVLVGIANGPLDIALPALRQRRTDTAWLGRAFAVSMALNSIGQPLGGLVAGPLLHVGVGFALVVCSGAALLASGLALVMIPAAVVAPVLSPANTITGP